jgi:c-di-GMP-binding flagellar brake protein YcgR
MDISAGGAFICCQKSMRQAAEVHMSFFDVPLLKRPLPVRARVVRSNIHCAEDALRPHGAGVRFTEISAEDQKLISTLVSDRLESEQSDTAVEDTEMST